VRKGKDYENKNKKRNRLHSPGTLKDNRNNGGDDLNREEQKFDSYYNLTSAGRFSGFVDAPQIKPDPPKNVNQKNGRSDKPDSHSQADSSDSDSTSGDNDSLFNRYYNITAGNRFSKFGEAPQIKHNPDDYFRSRYGYTATTKRERTHTKKPKKNNQNNNDPIVYTDTSKVKKLTREQRKRRIRISYVLTFLLVVGIAAFLSFNVLFKTNEIVVESESSLPYSDSEIIEKSGLKLYSNIFTARKKAAVRNIVDNFPYIENAEISYKIPATQIIKIEPAVPSYEVAVNGGYAIISEKGRVLEINPNQLSSIPLLKGIKVTDVEVGKYISFEKSNTEQILSEVIVNINDNKIPHIYGIDITNAASIKLHYDNRITIHIGLPEDVGYKLRTAMTIINNHLTPSDKGELDVSLSNTNRKASYFTPAYSNTVSTEIKTDNNESVSGEQTEEPASQSTGVRKAELSENEDTASSDT